MRVSGLLSLVWLALTTVTAAAQTSTPPAAAQTSPAAAAQGTAVTPQSQIQIRVYEGFGTLGPVYGHRGAPPYAVDVGVGLTGCPDGNTEISALNIGGWQYQLGTVCNGENRAPLAGSVTVRGVLGPGVPATPAPPATAPPAAPADMAIPPVIRCNPQTWSCAPAKP